VVVFILLVPVVLECQGIEELDVYKRNMPASNSFMLIVLAGVLWIGFRVDTARGKRLTR
jgi:hypothetical protein